MTPIAVPKVLYGTLALVRAQTEVTDLASSPQIIVTTLRPRREEGKRGRGGREGVESRGTIRERRRPWGEGDEAKPQEQGRRGEREGGAVPKEEGPGDRKSEPPGPGLPSKGARV